MSYSTDLSLLVGLQENSFVAWLSLQSNYLTRLINPAEAFLIKTLFLYVQKKLFLRQKTYSPIKVYNPEFKNTNA